MSHIIAVDLEASLALDVHSNQSSSLSSMGIYEINNRRVKYGEELTRSLPFQFNMKLYYEKLKPIFFTFTTEI